MTQERQRDPCDALEPDSEHRESDSTRRSFLKRSAVLLIYVAPLIETFDVDKAEGVVVSDTVSNPPPPAPTAPAGAQAESMSLNDEKDGKDDKKPKWGTRF